MFQPVAGIIAIVIAASGGLVRILIAIAFLPVAFLGARVGFGMLAVRPWARASMAVWAPLHVVFLPAIYWVMSKPITEGLFAAAVLGVILLGLYKAMSPSSEWAA